MAELATKRAQETEAVEVDEGESLDDIKAKLNHKTAGISADMLDTANTYDDKVAGETTLMIVGKCGERIQRFDARRSRVYELRNPNLKIKISQKI